MDFRKQQLDFEEEDRRYAELKRLHEAGDITEEDFDEQLKRSMVQDERGRWWAKSRKSGEWHYHDGRAWVRGTPSGYAPPTHEQNEGERRRRVGVSNAELALFASAVLVLVLTGVVAMYLYIGTPTPLPKSTSSGSASSESAGSESAGSESASSQSNSLERTLELEEQVPLPPRADGSCPKGYTLKQGSGCYAE